MIKVLRIRDVYPGSRILILPIPDPGSRIPDPGSRIQKQLQKRGVKKNFFIKHFFVATNFTKCKIILFLNCSRKKFGPNFKELRNFLPKKLSQSFQKYEFGIRDPRSGIRNKPIPDPGSRGQKGTGSRIRIRNTGSTSVPLVFAATDKKIGLLS
jgi:hypothetical protein